MVAYYYLWVSEWNKQDIDDMFRRITKRVAFACRYGHISLTDALSVDARYLDAFNRELGEIVKEENKPKNG